MLANSLHNNLTYFGSLAELFTGKIKWLSPKLFSLNSVLFDEFKHINLPDAPLVGSQ